MHDMNTEHGRTSRGIILCFGASQMDDSSGNHRFSKFWSEKPLEMTITVTNVCHQRNSRAQQRPHQERRFIHGWHRGHTPSARHDLSSREVRVCSLSSQQGRGVSLSWEDSAFSRSQQGSRLELDDGLCGRKGSSEARGWQVIAASHAERTVGWRWENCRLLG